MRFLSASAQHIGSRESQEDSFGFGEDLPPHAGFLALICDGMGGMEHGELASQTAVRAFREGYARKSAAESIPEALERCVFEANQAVLDLADDLGVLENIGTTLIATVATDAGLYYVSVGDSGLFFVSQGELSVLNRPHIFANFLERAVEKGLISRDDAERHPERGSLTSFIGIDLLEEVDRNREPLPLRSGDTILLATDGLFNSLSPQEMTRCMEGAPAEWPQELVASTLAKDCPHQDNVTVVTVTAE
ncbi:MAG TPA: protein phosphatase 2C domain-containing protein [Bryobacteraceae bacterium]|jgi:protein phosphatase